MRVGAVRAWAWAWVGEAVGEAEVAREWCWGGMGVSSMAEERILGEYVSF